MKLKISLLLFVAALVAMLTPRAAHADLGYWSASLIGTWKHPQTGAIYRFNSNATYTLTYAKATKNAVVATSGWWKIAPPTDKESGGSQEGPVALIVKQRKITLVDSHDKKHNKNLKMDTRLVVDTVGAPDAKNRNFYRINGVNWKRVK